jgi:hypothetical protein
VVADGRRRYSVAPHGRPGEHGKKHDAYFPNHLEKKLGEVKHLSAKEIYDAVTEDPQTFADPTDDISIVVIKRM